MDITDYHFIIEELAEELNCKKQFTCWAENTEKYITFTVPIEKVRRIDKYGKEVTKTISCILQYINKARFMASSLSNLINILSEGIHKIKCKNKNHVKLEEININIANVFLNTQTLKMI